MSRSRVEFRAARSGLLIFLSFSALFLAMGVSLAVQRSLAIAKPFLFISVGAALLTVLAFMRYRIVCEGDRLEYRRVYGTRVFDLRRLTGFSIAGPQAHGDPIVGLYLASGPEGRFESGQDLVINIKPLSREDIAALVGILEARQATPTLA
jgi:hypothetical protein